jgi:membrane peptidoglycan carboxypeptidase
LPSDAPPTGGRRGWRRFLPPWQLVVGTILVLIILFVVLILVAYARTPIPKANATAGNQTTIVYYKDGKTELGRWQQEDRQIIPLDQVPPYVRYEVYSAEDRTFEQNQGISPTGIARAAWKNLRGEPLQGGSTITQQFVKNYFLTSDRSYSRKWKELYISIKATREIGKPVILETYFNTVYFGRRAHGIEAASEAYFRKHARELSPSEGAYLAGILNGPELYDPYDGEKSEARAKARWNYVLDGMVTMGKMTPQARAQLQFPKIEPAKQQSTLMKGQTGYLMQMVAAELRTKAKLSQDQLETGGYRVVSTFDPGMVKALKEAVAEEFEQNKKLKIPAGTRMAAAVVAPNSGAVQAIYGGTQDYNGGRNAATQDSAAPGSQMKMFAIIAALQRTKAGKGDVTIDSTFDGRSPQHFKGYEEDKDIQNEGNVSFSRNLPLIKATAKSVNTAFMNLNEQIGPVNTRDAALAAGIPEDGIDNTLGNVLGGNKNVRPIDLAEAYATIASGGIHHDAYSVTKLTGPKGEEIYSGVNEGKRVFDADVIADVTYAMQQVVQDPGGTAHDSVFPLHRPVAGKTGTSDDHKSGWFNGFTPQLEMVVGLYRTIKVGNTYKETEVRVNGKLINGGDYPAKVWANFMARVLKGVPVAEFPPKAGVHSPNAPALTAPAEEEEETPSPTTVPVVTPPAVSSFTPTASETTGRPTRTEDQTETTTTGEETSSTRTRTPKPDPSQTTEPGGGGTTITGRPGSGNG